MNFKKTLLFYCDKIWNEYRLTPMIGGELEFYCDSPEKLQQYHPPKGILLEEESGKNQFEIKTPSFFNVFEFVDYIETAKKHLIDFAKKEKIHIYLSAMPFPDMPGSGMHIHLNLIDNNHLNVFELCEEKESLPMLFCVGGLIRFIKESMIFFAPNKECYNRYKKSMFTPMTISWGNNNRTAALRIISRANDIRRIEHRVPCADADPLAVVTAIMVSVYYGLSNRIIPPKKTYGNTFDKQYKLPYLPRSLDRSQKLFKRGRYNEFFLS